jgi:hypothetical protein
VIPLDLAEVVVYPQCVGVESERKMITKRCRKLWALYSVLYIRMEYYAANMIFILNMNPPV